MSFLGNFLKSAKDNVEAKTSKFSTPFKKKVKRCDLKTKQEIKEHSLEDIEKFLVDGANEAYENMKEELNKTDEEFLEEVSLLDKGKRAAKKTLLETVNGLKKDFEEPMRDLTSLSTENFNTLMKRYKFSDFLPYLSYDEKIACYENNDNTYGKVFLCSPRIRMGDSTSSAIEEMLSKMPDDLFLQFTMIGSKNLKQQLEYWREVHLIRANNENDELLRNAVNSTTDFFYSKTKVPPSATMKTKIKNNILLISIKSENKNQLFQFANTLENVLNSNHFNPVNATPQMLKPILWELFNGNHNLNEIPPYDPFCYFNRQLIMPTSDILVKDTGLKIDGRNWISLVPQTFPQEANIFDFGKKMGDYLSRALDTNQFKDTFLITSSICKLSKRRTKSVSRNHSMLLSQKWPEQLFRMFAAAKSESVGILDRIDKQKEGLFAYDLNILVSGENYKEASQNAQTIISYWNKGGLHEAMLLDEAIGIHQLNFIASLPMGVNHEYIFETTGKYRTMFADQLSQFIPAEADYPGTAPNLLLFSRRGQLAGLDLFVSNINFNAYLVATSGAGKSVLLNMIGFNSYARGDRVFVLDYDNSFLKLCDTLNGQYISLDPATPISFNPFSDIDSVSALQEDLAYLANFVYMLGSSKNEEDSQRQEKLIKSKIEEIIRELYEQIGSNMEISHIRDRLKTENDERFVDFANQLSSFCAGGMYAPFLSGKNEFNIAKEFIVVEFKGLENHPDVRDPLIMLLIYHINQLMYMSGDRSNKIQIILDEAHRFLGKNPRMDDFIEQAYRRARKYDGSIILATQGFDDIYNSKSGGLSKAGSVIVNNSSWKIFMKQTETSVNMLLNSGVFQFSDIDKEIIRSISTVKGEYSELFVMTPEEIKIPYRLVMNRFFYYLTTTNPADKLEIKKLTDSGLGIGEAIKILVDRDEKLRLEQEAKEKAEQEAMEASI